MQANVNSTGGAQRLGAGCVVAFMLPFFAGGAMAVWAGLHTLMRDGATSEAIIPLSVGAVFLAVSIAITAAVIAGLRTAAANAVLRDRNPDKPWLWRKEWSDGVILSHDAVQSVGLAFFAIVWNAITMPSAYLVLMRTDLHKDRAVLFVLLFPIIGVFILGIAAYQLIRAKKYGQSRLMLSHIPVSLGTTCRGEIVTRVKERPENGFDVKLQCVRRTITRSGKSSSTTETELWRDEQRVASAAAIPTFEGLRLPFAFDVPGDTEPADERVPGNQVLWRLSVGAETPGIDYATQFEIPVFRTGESQEHEVRRFTPHANEVASWNPSTESRITVRDDEIDIGTHARGRDVFAMLFFDLIWFGAIALMIHFHAPIIFAIFFILIGAVIAYAMLDAMIGKTTLRVDTTGITVRRRWFGRGRARTIGANDIKAVVANPTSNSSTYQIDVIGLTGQKTTIANWVALRRDAEMLAARIARSAAVQAPN